MHSTEAERKAAERQKNRARRDWFYRDVLPKLAKTSLAKSRLWVHGNRIKSAWRAYWAHRDASKTGIVLINSPTRHRGHA